MSDLDVNTPDAQNRTDSLRRPPLWGAYYWVPTPAESGSTWGLILNTDAGLEPDAGHTRLWLTVLDRLAVAWGKDARSLRRRLRDRYTGLPRGRICRKGSLSLVLHGQDAPVQDWQQAVLRRFRLEGLRASFRFDEHERMIAGDPEAVQDLLGLDLGLRGIFAEDDGEDEA